MAKVIIGTITIDMHNNIGIIHNTQGYLIIAGTLYQHIKLKIRSKGYTKIVHIKLIIRSKKYTMIKSKTNLLVTKIFTGQISNNSQIWYTKNNERILESLGSQGIKAFPAKVLCF